MRRLRLCLILWAVVEMALVPGACAQYGPPVISTLEVTGLLQGGTFRQGPIVGCAGNGVTDDTACIQAAMATGVVNLGPYIYAINSTGLVCNGPLAMTGTQGNQSNSYGTFSGFRPLSASTTALLSIQNGCNGSIFSKFSINDGAAGANTSGAAIAMAGNVSNVTFTDIAINAPCIGLDLNGNTIKVDRMQITQVAGTGCGGMRIGHLTTQSASTDPRITNSTIQSVQTGSGTPGDFGMRLEDTGGAYVSNNDILFFTVGTIIQPGASQIVATTFFDNTVLGDTTINSPLVIDTASSSAEVFDIRITQGWAAAFTSTSTAPGILIQNTGGAATFTGFHFLGQRVYDVPGDGVSVLAGSNITFKASAICAVGLNTGASTYVGIRLASGISNVAIQDSEIGATCNTTIGGHNNYQILFGGSNTQIIVTGNILYGFTTAAISGEPVQSGANSSNVIANNLGVDDDIPVLTAAATIDPTTFPTIVVTGATNIATINGCWAGRKLTIIGATALTFVTGGNIQAGATPAMNAVTGATCYGTSPGVWYLK